MSKTTHRITLALASLIWLGILLNIALPFPPPWGKVLKLFGLGILLIHALELVGFRKLLGASGNTKAVDALLILIAGAFHASWLAKAKAQLSAATPPGEADQP